ncbi:polysaccharide deacetylase family protein [Rhodohalobacter barkolensis]|nr:polysaccharide deacetylase family protein [Rhodohalobacter barkolensis]
MRDAFGVKMDPTDRVFEHTERILEIFSEKSFKGTFFILGIIAEHYPELVKRIGSEGHELAVHGYNHLIFSKMTPEKAFQELDSAKKLIEDLSGQEVYGHRAPAFSINPKTSWGLDVIAKCGFTYDSSIMPCKGLRYGWPEFSKNIVMVNTANGNRIIEVPMSTTKFLSREIPTCGGSYLRLLPYNMTKKFFKKVQKEKPVVVYIHPYELDNQRYPEYFFTELKKASIKKNLSLRSNWLFRNTVEEKFRKLMALSGSKPIIDIIKEKQEAAELPVFEISD